jgi:hypothetical protein
VQGRELGPHGDAQLGVEVRERLVEEEGRGIADDGAADRDALPLPARELGGAAVEEVLDPSIRAASPSRATISARAMRVFSSPKDRFWRTVMCG